MSGKLRAERDRQTGDWEEDSAAVDKFWQHFASRDGDREGGDMGSFEEETAHLEQNLKRKSKVLPIFLSIAVVAMVGGAVWHFYGGAKSNSATAASLPVLSAPAGKVKDKPADEGGLTIQHRDKAVLNDGLDVADGQTVEHLLPPPEEPKAIEPATKIASTSPIVVAAETEQPSDNSAEVAEATPPTVSDAIEQIKTAEEAAENAPAKPQKTIDQVVEQLVQIPTDSGFLLQLASVKNRDGVDRDGSRLKKRFPNLLGDMKLIVEEAVVNGNTYYRIQAGPFPTKATASDVCAQLKVKNQGCLLKNKKS